MVSRVEMTVVRRLFAAAEKAVGAGRSHGKTRTVVEVRETSPKVLECVRVLRARRKGGAHVRRVRRVNDYASCRYNVAIP
jgi:hypothetical protein